MSNVLLAADPELFIIDNNDKYPVSAIGHIGGSKNEPLRKGDGTWQEDNVAVEFTIDPTSDVDEFVNRIMAQHHTLAEHVYKINADWGLCTASSAVFPEEELTHPNARIAGCDPDYDAWTGETNPAIDLSSTTLRCAGGHIHIDLPRMYVNEEGQRLAAKGADLLIGVWETSESFDPYRRNLYGKAGAYRPKAYGIEYRTPSNWWIFRSDRIRTMFNKAQLLASDVEKWGELAEQFEKELKAAINFGDPEALAVLNRVVENNA